MTSTCGELASSSQDRTKSRVAQRLNGCGPANLLHSNPKEPGTSWFSDAIPTYVAKRRRSGGANIARDLSTAESRLALFIELIGDHPVDTYGFDVATEKEARKLKALPLDPEIDYSIFRGLDFDAIARRERAAGPPKRK